MECAGALLRLLWVFGLVFGAGMARRGLLPTQFRVRPVGSLPAGMQPLVGKRGEFRPAPAAAGHRLSAQALATASVLAAFVCLATFDSEVLAADSGSGSGTQSTKISESPLPPRLSTWDLFGRIQRLEDTSFTKEDANAMEARMEARMDKAEAKTAALFLILSVVYVTQRKDDKQDAKAMEARMDKAEAERKEDAKAMEARMDKAEARMQENLRLSTFLTIVSLFLSLAANEGFVAKLFPQR
jgi:hypothetical protein